MKNLNSILSKIEKIELAEVNVELKSVDKFKTEYNKIQSGNTAQYISELQSIQKRVLKGINDVGDYKDKVEKVIQGLNSLGLTDEIKDFQFLRNDIQNDFDELIFINDKLKSL
jgi:hypothetical protein